MQAGSRGGGGDGRLRVRRCMIGGPDATDVPWQVGASEMCRGGVGTRSAGGVGAMSISKRSDGSLCAGVVPKRRTAELARRKQRGGSSRLARGTGMATFSLRGGRAPQDASTAVRASSICHLG